MLAHLTVETGARAGHTFVVRPGPPFVVGSDPGAQTRLEGAAPRHVALIVGARGLEVVDLAGGVRLNGAALAPRQPVAAGSGDALELAGVVLRIELDGVPEPARGAAPAALLPPDLGHDLEVVRLLGQGGMGRVLAARRRSDGQTVAVKLLHEAIGAGSAEHRRLVTEGQVGLRIRSPFVVRVLECRVAPDGRALIVMELVRGPSLAEHLDRHGRLALVDAWRLGGQVAEALTAAHAVNVVHRDVKPGNVLLSPEGAKLTDFGIARDLQARARSLTASGVGLGTLAYMAPEQAVSARDADAAADLYGLGATLFHALAGRAPFLVASFPDVQRLLTEPPPALASLRPDAPAPLSDLVHELLAKDPFDRPSSAREVVARLAAMRPA